MKKLKFAVIIMFLSLAICPGIYAQDELDPPPTAPIDYYVLPAAIFALILGMYFVYKCKLKTEMK